ncbi:MAG TPA: DsbA family protein [Acidimicrobiales bacterium]|nr:DsbA family protein [Acidimicrobiales bacterium]
MKATGRDFSITFDYRCPFARNAHEHVLTALAAGADYRVRFLPFSLSQAHVAEGETPVWEDPGARDQLLAIAAGIVVRERYVELFPAAHLSLFAARHDDSSDLRDEKVVHAALARAGVDDAAVFAELAAGWPFDLVRNEHEAAVRDHAVFGVPTFIVGQLAVFVRIMTRPRDDAELALATIERLLELLVDHPELNEFKHTSIPR